MQSPKRNKQKGHGSNSQQHENSFKHDESSSARAQAIPRWEIVIQAEPRAQIEGSASWHARSNRAPGGCLSRSRRSVLQDERHRNSHSSRAFNVQKVRAKRDWLDGTEGQDESH